MMNLILASEIIAVGYIFKKLFKRRRQCVVVYLSKGPSLLVLSVRTVQSARYRIVAVFFKTQSHNQDFLTLTLKFWLSRAERRKSDKIAILFRFLFCKKVRPRGFLRMVLFTVNYDRIRCGRLYCNKSWSRRQQ